MNPVERPLLVTGSHRSGSTWLGKMLASAQGVYYVQEPFNIVGRQRWMEPRPTHQFLYVDEFNEAEWSGPVERVLELRYPLVAHLRRRPDRLTARRVAGVAARAAVARRRGDVALVKDPIAVFSAPWLARRFDVVPVVLVRDPVAFVGSLVARGWSFDFWHWTEQPELMSRHLNAFDSEIRSMLDGPHSIVEQGIVQWNAIYSFVARFQSDCPDAIVVDYERLASDPLVEVETLFGRLGLEFGPEQRVAVLEYSSAEGGGSSAIDVRRDSRAALDTWSERLGASDVQRIRESTASVLHQFRPSP